MLKNSLSQLDWEDKYTSGRWRRKIFEHPCLTLLAVSDSLLAASAALPVIVTTIAEYLTVAGTVATAISQTAVESR